MLEPRPVVVQTSLETSVGLTGGEEVRTGADQTRGVIPTSPK